MRFYYTIRVFIGYPIRISNIVSIVAAYGVLGEDFLIIDDDFKGLKFQPVEMGFNIWPF